VGSRQGRLKVDPQALLRGYGHDHGTGPDRGATFNADVDTIVVLAHLLNRCLQED
jgi:hypothetical protein